MGSIPTLGTNRSNELRDCTVAHCASFDWFTRASCNASLMSFLIVFLFVMGESCCATWQEERQKRVTAGGTPRSSSGAVTQTERNPATRLTEHIYSVDHSDGPYTAITITPKSRPPAAQRLQGAGWLADL